MFKVELLYPEGEGKAAKKYGMPQEMEKDLNLHVLYQTMAKGNEEIYNSCRQVMMSPITNKKVLRFRQQMVSDAVGHPEFYAEIYRIADEAIKQIEKGGKRNRESSKTIQIYESLSLLLILLKYLNQLKNHLRGEQAEQTDGMMYFVEQFREYYSDEFAKDLQQMTEDMSFLLKGGRLVMTAGVTGGLKCGNAVVNYLVPINYRDMGKVRQTLRRIILRFFSPEAVMLKETALKQEAARMEENGLHHVIQMYQGVINEFQELFVRLRTQIGFYVGCANLYRSLKHLNMQVSFPHLCREEGHVDIRNLYEISMALTTLKNPVDNSFDDFCKLHIISGANQGGKSTFLRSVGIAQVMMQAGMFVPAGYYEGRLYDNILTHFSRREDSTMNSGRLDEEMKRMDRIVNLITPESLVLLNESFASTTEKEGSQIAENIIQAFYDSGVHVFSVTHLFAFASRMYEKKLPEARFFSAERKEDGTRTYKMIDHEPTETSFGLDLFHEMIGI